MIVRVLGLGQFEVAEADLESFAALDDELSDAVDGEDLDGYQRVVAALIAETTKVGAPLPLDDLRPSDLIIPAADSSPDEVRQMLASERPSPP